MRILEILIRKDEEAVKNIGDPAALMGVYAIDAEEKITADAIAQGKSEADFEAILDQTAQAAFDPLKLLMGEATRPLPAGGGRGNGSERSDEKTRNMPSLYADDFHYLKEAVAYLKQSETLSSEFEDADRQVELTAPTN